MKRRLHTRVAWVVRRLSGRGPDLEFDTRARARKRRAFDRACGISGRVERIKLRRGRR